MTRSNGYRAALSFAALAALTMGVARGQQKEGLGERIGDKVKEEAAAAKRLAGRAGDSIRGEFERAKASVNALNVEARVYGRLHWDKSLEGATLDISMAKDGTVTLTGVVADLAAKARAVQLAGDTVGVTRVVNQLTTPSSPATP